MSKRGRPNTGVRRGAWEKRWGRYWRRAYRQWRSHQSKCGYPPPLHVRIGGVRTDGFEFPSLANEPLEHYVSRTGVVNPNGSIPGITYVQSEVTNRNPPHRSLQYIGGGPVGVLTTHQKVSWGACQCRNILRRKRKAGRLKGDRFFAAAAFRYWCGTRCTFWPAWDPDHRTPVGP